MTAAFNFMAEIILRDYQQDAVNKAVNSIELEGNDLLVLATGAGKSIVIAEIAKRLNRDIGILQPSAEILEQNVDKLKHFVPEWQIGIFSASCGSKRISKYTFGMIGSMYRKADRFRHIKHWIIDEAHLHDIKNTSGMYATFFRAVQPEKILGLTATPYRNVTGYHQSGDGLYATTTLKLLNRMKTSKNGDMFWKRILINIGIGDLVARGYLCPVEYDCRTFLTHEQMKLNKSQTDFDLDDFVGRIGNRQRQVVECVRDAEAKFNSVLVFCANVAQAKRFAELVPGCRYVSAKTPDFERGKLIHDFKNGRVKTVFNVGVLTTGFDHPALDCIVLLRPTRSLLLYVQMVGRGVRISPGKTHCTVIDWTNTVEQMGPVESVELRREQFPEFQYPMWEIFAGPTGQDRWHNRPLYSYEIKQKGYKRAVAAKRGWSKPW